MAKSKLGNENECEEFSSGTDSETEGWWYHGCSMKDAYGHTI